MSIGPASFSALTSTQSTVDAARNRQETISQQRATSLDLKAAQAAGVGATDGQEHSTNERDGDGRTPWQLGGQAAKSGNYGELPTDLSANQPLGRDASGESGSQLDLLG